MDQLAARKLDRIVVTKHGRPVAVPFPPPTPEEIAEDFFGFMRSVAAPPDFDFTAPVLDEPPGLWSNGASQDHPLAEEAERSGRSQRWRSRNSRPALTKGLPS